MTPSPETVEFFFDVGSPYSYLAAARIDSLRSKTGAHVVWRPFLLGGVFKASGNDMPARVAAKARWMLTDLSAWARHCGVPFKMSSRFPLVTILPQRALVAAGRVAGPEALEKLAMALFAAYWAEDRDVSKAEVVSAVADSVGLDGPALVAAAQEPAVKDELRATTDEAVARGAFGAPTFFVGERMYWGNDRIELLESDLSQGTRA
jgi:2-hydroxychromene-2-carboxylate isomerase